MSLRDTLELFALALGVVAVALATHLWWATVLAAAVALFYLSHAWSWGGDDPSEADQMRAQLNDVVAVGRKSRVTRESVLDAVDAIASGPKDEDVTANGSTQ